MSRENLSNIATGAISQLGPRTISINTVDDSITFGEKHLVEFSLPQFTLKEEKLYQGGASGGRQPQGRPEEDKTWGNWLNPSSTRY
jgi:hypothetical protein